GAVVSWVRRERVKYGASLSVRIFGSPHTDWPLTLSDGMVVAEERNPEPIQPAFVPFDLGPIPARQEIAQEVLQDWVRAEIRIVIAAITRTLSLKVLTSLVRSRIVLPSEAEAIPEVESVWIDTPGVNEF